MAGPYRTVPERAGQGRAPPPRGAAGSHGRPLPHRSGTGRARPSSAAARRCRIPWPAPTAPFRNGPGKAERRRREALPDPMTGVRCRTVPERAGSELTRPGRILGAAPVPPKDQDPGRPELQGPGPGALRWPWSPASPAGPAARPGTPPGSCGSWRGRRAAADCESADPSAYGTRSSPRPHVDEDGSVSDVPRWTGPRPRISRSRISCDAGTERPRRTIEAPFGGSGLPSFQQPVVDANWLMRFPSDWTNSSPVLNFRHACQIFAVPGSG